MNLDAELRDKLIKQLYRKLQLYDLPPYYLQSNISAGEISLKLDTCTIIFNYKIVPSVCVYIIISAGGYARYINHEGLIIGHEKVYWPGHTVTVDNLYRVLTTCALGLFSNKRGALEECDKCPYQLSCLVQDPVTPTMRKVINGNAKKL